MPQKSTHSKDYFHPSVHIISSLSLVKRISEMLLSSWPSEARVTANAVKILGEAVLIQCAANGSPKWCQL